MKNKFPVVLVHGILGFGGDELGELNYWGIAMRTHSSQKKFEASVGPISSAHDRACELLAQINETHRPVIITQNGEPKAVIQDAESYEKMVNSLNLMKILAHSEKDIKEGNTIKQETLFKQVEDKLLKKKIRK